MLVIQGHEQLGVATVKQVASYVGLVDEQRSVVQPVDRPQQQTRGEQEVAERGGRYGSDGGGEVARTKDIKRRKPLPSGKRLRRVWSGSPGLVRTPQSDLQLFWKYVEAAKLVG
ncbi:hypothetical protein [Neolewinella maritima]|uniref:hypothetical protein n=1 Tax=Neolewinella maritima TaxID=1383882 RepID=UPI001EE7DBBF|nr:hypothetical protein [Neolewinella maritima]